MDLDAEPTTERCLLENPVFTMLGIVTFRRAEADGTPVMLVPLGDKQAAMPLRALQREFNIDDASADGRMLGLIAEALDYVTALQVGDALPSEVLSGRASWQPSARHRRLASGKLRMQLLEWLDPTAIVEDSAEAPVAERLETDPELRAKIQRAFDEAAKALELPGAQAVMAVVADIAEELSYIEALRETVLGRIEALVTRLEKLVAGASLNADRQTILSRVRRLARQALHQISQRFVDVDAQTGEVMATLRNVDSQRTYIRSNRDWLHRSGRAWEPILAAWEGASPALDDAAWARLARTYQFLAPRFMPVQEWLSIASQQAARKRKPEHVMQW